MRNFRKTLAGLLVQTIWLCVVVSTPGHASAASFYSANSMLASAHEVASSFWCGTMSFITVPLGFCQETEGEGSAPSSDQLPSPEQPDTPVSSESDKIDETPLATTSRSTTASTSVSESRIIRETPTYVTEHITNQYVTNPTTVIKEVIRETVRDSGGDSSIDTSHFVTRSLFDAQVDATHNSFSDADDGITDRLAESVETDLLTVTGNGSFSGELDVTSGLAVGTSTTQDIFTLDGAAYLASISPNQTTNRLYNQSGSLYWAGNIVAGSSVGTWDTSGGNVYRLTGQVGLGTSTPRGTLHIVRPDITGTVNTSIKFDRVGDFTTRHIDIASDNSFRISRTGIKDDFIIASSGDAGVGVSSPEGKLHVRGSGTGTSTAFMVDDSTGTKRFVIQDNGYVGVGTTSPDEMLHIAGGSLSITGTIYDSVGENLNVGRDDDISFNLGQVFFDSSSGNVGIGTTTPDSKLSIHTGSTTEIARIQATNDAAVSLDTRVYGSADTGNVAGITRGNWANLAAYGPGLNGMIISNEHAVPLVFTSDATERMRIDGTGNVGIGSSTPSRLLTVAGDTYTQGLEFTSATGTNLTLGTTTSRGLLTVDGDIHVGDASTPALFVDESTDSIGVGLTNPSKGIEIANTGQGSGLISSLAFIGRHSAGSTFASVSHKDHISNTGFALRMSSGGRTELNAASGEHINFYTDGFNFAGQIDDNQQWNIGTTTSRGLLTVDGDFFVGNTSLAALFADVSTGNVGIGTTTPGYDLTVNNQIAVRDPAGAAALTLRGGGANTNFIANSTTTNLLSVAGGTGFDDGANYIVYGENAPTGAGDILMRYGSQNKDISTADVHFQYQSTGPTFTTIAKFTDSGVLLTPSSTGKVGIGTTNPDKKLSVEGTDPTLLQLTRTGSIVNTNIQFTNDAGSVYAGAWGTDFAIGPNQNLSSNPWLYIDDGNIGVGTTTPDSPLHVTGGNITLDTLAGLDVRNGDAISFMDFNFPEVTTTNAVIRLFRSTNTSGDPTFTVHAGDGTAEYDFQVNSQGGNTSLVRQGGKVAVGNTTARGKLTVVGAGNFSTTTTDFTGSAVHINTSNMASTSGQVGPGVTFSQSWSDGAIGAAIAPYQANGDVNTMGLSFYVHGPISADPLTRAMTIDSDGNIGVGTANPNQEFQVAGTGQFDTAVRVGTDGGTVGGDDNLITTGVSSAWLNVKGGSGRAKLSLGNDSFNIISGNTNGGIRFRTGASSSTAIGDEVMRLHQSGGLALGSAYVSTDPGAGSFIASGSVGIGTTSPGAKLYVTGGSSDKTTAVFDGSDTDAIPLVVTGSSSVTKFSVDNAAPSDTNNTTKFGLNQLTTSQSRTLFEFQSTWSDNIDATRTSQTDFVTANNGSFATTMTLLNGNVGIGSTTPSRTLTVGSGDLFVGTSSAATLFADTSEDRVGIGTSNPERILDIVGERAVAQIRRYATSTNGNPATAEAGFLFKKARGTEESPLVVQDGDGLGTMQSYGWDGDSFEPSSVIRGRVNGSVSDGIVPGSLVFETTNTSGTLTERMVVDAAGNVGIGTTSPSSNLHVYDGFSGGLAPSSHELVVEDDAAAVISIRTPNNASGNLYFSDADDDNIGRITYDHTTDSLRLWANNAERLTVDSDGDVGIGTTTPSSKLQVRANSNSTTDYPLTISNSSNNYGLQIGAYGLSNKTFGAPNIDYTMEIGGDLALMTDGNVGINTTIPDGLLDIQQTADDAEAFVVRRNSNQYITMLTEGTAPAIRTHSTPSNAKPFVFHATTDGSNTAPSAGANGFQFRIRGSNVMDIDDSGDVGIGTTDPSEKLHVVTGDGNGVLIDAAATANLNTFLELRESATSDHGGRLFLEGSGNYVSLQSKLSGSYTDALTVPYSGTNQGYVGIGTTTPETKLYVVGDTTDNFISTIENTRAFQSGADGLLVKTGSVVANSQTRDHFQVESGDGVIFNIGQVGSDVVSYFNQGNVGFGTTTPSEKLTVAGTIQATNLQGGATNLTTDASGNIIRDPSDARLKTNVTEIDSALETVLQLRGVRYEWKDKERFGKQMEIGFIAQEVDTLVPEAVRKGGEYWSLNTRNMVAVVVEGFKDFYTEFEVLRDEVAGFSKKLISNEIVVKKQLCLNDTCINEADLQAMLAAADRTDGSGHPSNEATGNDPVPNEEADETHEGGNESESQQNSGVNYQDQDGEAESATSTATTTSQQSTQSDSGADDDDESIASTSDSSVETTEELPGDGSEVDTDTSNESGDDSASTDTEGTGGEPTEDESGADKPKEESEPEAAVEELEPEADPEPEPTPEEDAGETGE